MLQLLSKWYAKEVGRLMTLWILCCTPVACWCHAISNIHPNSETITARLIILRNTDTTLQPLSKWYAREVGRLMTLCVLCCMAGPIPQRAISQWKRHGLLLRRIPSRVPLRPDRPIANSKEYRCDIYETSIRRFRVGSMSKRCRPETLCYLEWCRQISHGIFYHP